MNYNRDKSILTLATGKKLYADMAVNLGLSIRHWAPKYRFQIATDLPTEFFPKELDFEILRFPEGSLGVGFSSKLRLDLITTSEKTLFIDGDCLLFGELDSIFDRFSGHPVSVVGGSISEGEWFGDVKSVLGKMGLKEMPKFNGGIYYLERGPVCSSVYARARELESRYDELGLVRLRGRPNDELLMSLAMAEYGMKAIPDDGMIMGDLYSYSGIPSLNILRGRTLLRNPPKTSFLHRDWNPLAKASPVIVHFLGDAHNLPEYQTDVLALNLNNRGIPSCVSRSISCFFILYPGIVKRSIKNIMRPIFHRIFGVRRIIKSERI
jgi:hypothetical protein